MEKAAAVLLGRELRTTLGGEGWGCYGGESSVVCATGVGVENDGVEEVGLDFAADWYLSPLSPPSRLNLRHPRPLSSTPLAIQGCTSLLSFLVLVLGNFLHPLHLHHLHSLQSHFFTFFFLIVFTLIRFILFILILFPCSRAQTDSLPEHKNTFSARQAVFCLRFWSCTWSSFW